MKRIIEGVMIAVLSSAITWAAGHWTDAREESAQAWQGAANGLGQFEGAAWWTAAITFGLAIVVRRARSWEPSFWELDLYLPSPAIVLTSTSVVAVTAAYGLRLSGGGSIWGLTLVGLAAYVALRSLARLRWSLRRLLEPGGL